MASFERREKRWRVKVRVRGVSKSATFDSKAQAAKWALEQEAEAKAPGSATKDGLHKAMRRYMEEVSPTKPGGVWEVRRMPAMMEAIPDVPLSSLTPEHIAEWRDARLKGTLERRPVTGATVNREMNLLSAVIEQARKEWRWIKANPIRDTSRPPKARARSRIMTEAERDALCDALGYAEAGPVTTLQQEVAIAMLVALESGMRAGEMIGLEWSNVHLARRFVTLPKTKNGDARDVPLSSRAVELLERMKGRDKLKVFTVDSASRDTLFRKARARCKIEGLTFHDTRATACTLLARKVDVLTLARIIGHRDLNSLLIYFREGASSIADRLG